MYSFNLIFGVVNLIKTSDTIYEICYSKHEMKNGIAPFIKLIGKLTTKKNREFVICEWKKMHFY